MIFKGELDQVKNAPKWCILQVATSVRKLLKKCAKTLVFSNDKSGRLAIIFDVSNGVVIGLWAFLAIFRWVLLPNW